MSIVSAMNAFEVWEFGCDLPRKGGAKCMNMNRKRIIQILLLLIVFIVVEATVHRDATAKADSPQEVTSLIVVRVQQK